jgi:HD-GYP domain-containing protein (c-di-GMP phosphodiesterase class II)
MHTENGRPVLSVLFIEDNPNDVDRIVRLLEERWHIAFKRVENESGLMLALAEAWDVILCDYVLPSFSAERALAVVKERLIEKNARMIPFIIMSGIVNEDAAIYLILRGARDFIDKNHFARLPLAIHRELRVDIELLAAQMKVEESHDAVIEAWGKALEMRDFYTKGHTERTTALALRLAVAMNVSHKEFVNLNRGALLHDIGKMAIGDTILLKPDALTLEELEVMKRHPRYAHEMLKHIPFLKEAAVVPLYHHERWNGTGYPEGLMGSKIPLLARIFAIVDVYDALTTDRPYRKSWEKSKAIAYLLDEAGKLFDPDIVEKFVELVGRG